MWDLVERSHKGEVSNKFHGGRGGGQHEGNYNGDGENYKNGRKIYNNDNGQGYGISQNQMREKNVIFAKDCSHKCERCRHHVYNPIGLYVQTKRSRPC